MSGFGYVAGAKQYRYKYNDKMCFIFTVEPVFDTFDISSTQDDTNILLGTTVKFTVNTVQGEMVSYR